MQTLDARDTTAVLAMTYTEVDPPAGWAADGTDRWYRCCVGRPGDGHPVVVTVRSDADGLELVDVLDMLAAEAGIVEESDSFDSWADQLGLDADSRRAERSYRNARRQAARLRELMGESEYHRLVQSAARL